MKEAAGEANMTIVTIVLIAIVLGAGTLIVTNIVNGMGDKASCAEAGGALGSDGCCYLSNGKIDSANSDNKSCTVS